MHNKELNKQFERHEALSGGHEYIKKEREKAHWKKLCRGQVIFPHICVVCIGLKEGLSSSQAHTNAIELIRIIVLHIWDSGGHVGGGIGIDICWRECLIHLLLVLSIWVHSCIYDIMANQIKKGCNVWFFFSQKCNCVNMKMLSYPHTPPSIALLMQMPASTFATKFHRLNKLSGSSIQLIQYHPEPYEGPGTAATISCSVYKRGL